MHRWVPLLLVGLAAACGRHGFEPLDDPRLATLEVRADGKVLAIVPAFDPDLHTYQVEVGLTVGRVKLFGTPIDPETTISSTPANPIPLAFGPTTLTATGTSPAGATATYDVTVVRTSTVAHQAYLKASNTELGDGFGTSIAISDDTLVVGAPYEDSAATGVNGNQADNSVPDSGAAFVFVRTGATWTQQAYLKASNTAPGAGFGISVAISGDTVVVSANVEDGVATDSGAAYVFVRSGTTWTQQAYLKASNAATSDLFGTSVGIAGDTVVVGARGEDSGARGINGNEADDSQVQSGAVYVFARTGATWVQQAYVKSSNSEAGDLFGDFVEISGDTLIVPALGEDSNATGVDGDQTNNLASGSGAVYVFQRTGSTWIQQAYLKASNTSVNDLFGRSLSIAGDTVVVGAPGESSTAAQAGAAYVFTRTGTTWSPEAYLEASNAEADDGFGIAVRVAGDGIAIGAFGEDGASTGIDGDQTSNTLSRSGAMYLFARTTTTWAQQRYVKASTTDVNDVFGATIGLTGDSIVVSAPSEDSAATGIDGDQASNAAPDSGALFVFR